MTRHVVLRLGVRVFDEAKLAAHVAGRDVETDTLEAKVLEALVAEGPLAPVDFGCEVSEVHCAVSAADLTPAPAGVVRDGMAVIRKLTAIASGIEHEETTYVHECLSVLGQVADSMEGNRVPPREGPPPRLTPAQFVQSVHKLLRPLGDPDGEVNGADFIDEVSRLLDLAGHPQRAPFREPSVAATTGAIMGAMQAADRGSILGLPIETDLHIDDADAAQDQANTRGLSGSGDDDDEPDTGHPDDHMNPGGLGGW